jgi:hypothetical protein
MRPLAVGVSVANGCVNERTPVVFHVIGTPAHHNEHKICAAVAQS